ncbi:PAS domain S-box protein [Myxococcota bacterium]
MEAVAHGGPILVVDDDAVSRHVLVQTLTLAGLHCVSVASGAEALSWLVQSTPSVVLLDLVMPEPDGYVVLRHIRTYPKLADTPVVVLTALDSDEEISRVFASGADDYVHKPFRSAELVARIRGQIRLREYMERLSRRERDSQAVLELTQTLALTLDVSDLLFVVVKRVAEVARVDRCSIVLVGDADDVGFVVASSDDAELHELPIDLVSYPEIREVMSTGRPLAIHDASQHPLLQVPREGEQTLGFSSLALVPILHERRPMGVIFLRSRSSPGVDDYEMALVQTVANATAIALRNARILQSLRDETMQSTHARVEAERRVQLFQRYADFFESAADGMIVVDRHGRVLFTNPRARELIGYTETELVGLPLDELLVEEERARARRLLRGFGEGIYPRGIDLKIRTSLPDPMVANVSFSSVLHGDRAVLFSFRDVTLERKTAIELKQTKEFLERVIESSVDGIVSADPRGTILIFNRAACRIFGCSAGDVVGRVNIEQLYPPGVARDVMRKIRDPRLCGHGRLEDYRVDMVATNGELVPVSLSASLILENNRPVGSVGIINDMRERLRMEARLNRAQEELRTREKQALIAELAGAAAHELNQPLTAVINFAGLLAKKLEPDPTLNRAASVIVNESERMAEIVRKIGKITRYETKSYVGGAKILDLEKASEDTGTGHEPASVSRRVDE